MDAAYPPVRVTGAEKYLMLGLLMLSLLLLYAAPPPPPAGLHYSDYVKVKVLE